MSLCEAYSLIWRTSMEISTKPFNLIFEKLDTVKSPTQDISVLAALHRDLHGLHAGAGQISTEYLKNKYLADALKHDPADLFCMQSRFSIADRTSEDLVETLTLHAPTFFTTKSTLGYFNAMSTTASALAAPIDAAGHAEIIAKHQKELAALNKKNPLRRQADASTVTFTVTRRVTSATTVMFSRPMRKNRHCAAPPRCHRSLNSCPMSAVDAQVKASV